MIRVFETFAGIGSQTKALKNIGVPHEVVALSEWDINSLMVYDRVHNSHKPKPTIPSKEDMIKYLSQFTFSADTKNPIKNIAKLPQQKLEDLYVANIRNHNLGSIVDLNLNSIPDHDLLTYSFPCQAISLQGKQKGLTKGTKTSSSLLWEIEKILNYLHDNNRLPKFLLMENVSALFSPKFKASFQLWKDFLTSLGYDTKEALLTASHFNIPQNRTRAFAISVLNDKSLFNSINISNGPLTKLTISDIMEYSVDDKYYLPELNGKINLNTEKEVIKKSGICSTMLENYTSFQSENALYLVNGIAPTITATGAQSRIKVWDHKAQCIRMLTPKEHWRLMGFTDRDFYNALEGNTVISEALLKKMAGNSIVVNVLEGVFGEMFK